VCELANNPGLCRTLGESGRKFVAENFDRDVLAARYARVIEDVLVKASADYVPASGRASG